MLVIVDKNTITVSKSKLSNQFSNLINGIQLEIKSKTKIKASQLLCPFL